MLKQIGPLEADVDKIRKIRHKDTQFRILYVFKLCILFLWWPRGVRLYNKRFAMRVRALSLMTNFVATWNRKFDIETILILVCTTKTIPKTGETTEMLPETIHLTFNHIYWISWDKSLTTNLYYFPIDFPASLPASYLTYFESHFLQILLLPRGWATPETQDYIANI